MKPLSVDYVNWLHNLKRKIQEAQLKAAIGINRILVDMYWELGKEIVSKEKDYSYGENFLEQLAKDLKREFPEIKGFSRRNLYLIRQWYLFFFENGQVVHQAVAQLPWRHQTLLIQKFKDLQIIILYAEATHKNGWSRDTLEANINSEYHKRIGKTDNNFKLTLPKIQSDLAIESIKDPYNFDFLELGDDAQEREIERELTSRITDFMLELGKGFAFVGKQFKLEIGDSEYFMDLLFYHLHLRCYVIIELKAGKFKPEYAGKLNFYLSGVDSQIKHEDDNPSIGILLCRTKDKIEVEYALRDLNKPIGISAFELSQIIPDDLKTQLPTIEEVERNLFDSDEPKDIK